LPVEAVTTHFSFKPGGLGHDEERSPVLERRAGIQPVILDPDVFEASSLPSAATGWKNGVLPTG
jgi:hypothetical protein